MTYQYVSCTFKYLKHLINVALSNIVVSLVIEKMHLKFVGSEQTKNLVELPVERRKQSLTQSNTKQSRWHGL